MLRRIRVLLAKPLNRTVSRTQHAVDFRLQRERNPQALIAVRDVPPLMPQFEPKPLLWSDFVDLMTSLRETTGTEAKHESLALWLYRNNVCLFTPSAISQILDLFLLGTALFRVFELGETRLGNNVMADIGSCMYHPFGHSQESYPRTFRAPHASTLASSMYGSPDLAETMAHILRPVDVSPPPGANVVSFADMYTRILNLSSLKRTAISGGNHSHASTEAALRETLSMLATRGDVEAFLRIILGTQRVGLQTKHLDPIQRILSVISHDLRKSQPDTVEGQTLWDKYIAGHSLDKYETPEQEAARKVGLIRQGISPRGRKPLNPEVGTAKIVDSLHGTAAADRLACDVPVEDALQALDSYAASVRGGSPTTLKNPFAPQLAEAAVSFTDAVRQTIIQPVQRFALVGTTNSMDERLRERGLSFRQPLSHIPTLSLPPPDPKHPDSFPSQRDLDPIFAFADVCVRPTASPSVRASVLDAAVESLRDHPHIAQCRVVELGSKLPSTRATSGGNAELPSDVAADGNGGDTVRGDRAAQFIESIPQATMSASRRMGSLVTPFVRTILTYPPTYAFRVTTTLHHFPVIPVAPGDVLVEPKLDGERLIAHIRLADAPKGEASVDRITVFQRIGRFARLSRANVVREALTPLRDFLRAKGFTNGLVVIDGEIIPTRNGRILPLGILGVRRRDENAAVPTFFAFDMHYCGHQDLRRVPLLLRRAVMERLLGEYASSPFSLSENLSPTPTRDIEVATWRDSITSSALLPRAANGAPLRVVTPSSHSLGVDDSSGRPVEHPLCGLIPGTCLGLVTQYTLREAADLRRVYGVMGKADSEGLMVKSPLGNILHGERRFWAKLKPDCLKSGGDTLDLLVVGAIPGVGRFGGSYSSLVLAVRDETTGHMVVICRSSGIDAGTRLQVQHYIDSTETVDSSNAPGWLCEHGLSADDRLLGRSIGRTVLWLAAEPVEPLIVEVNHMGVLRTVSQLARTLSGSRYSLRFPRVTRIRKDKDLSTVTSFSTIRSMYDARLNRGIASDEEMSAAEGAAADMLLRSAALREEYVAAAEKQESQVSRKASSPNQSIRRTRTPPDDLNADSDDSSVAVTKRSGAAAKKQGQDRGSRSQGPRGGASSAV